MHSSISAGNLGLRNFFLGSSSSMTLADDVAAVTLSEYANQILLNAFTRWCNWSRMTIRIDK